jgi:3-hydroxyisobutyrate dehydrogenase-like beta-hydroxyacid dehydrogenase
MVKGLEALTYECFVAAARAGVDKDVMASLAKSFPGLDWPAMVEYNLERMATHGARRAAEMEQVADTVRELGIAPLMANATVAHQREMSAIGKNPDVRAAVARDDGTMLKTVNAVAQARKN